MRAFLRSHDKNGGSLVSALCCGLIVASLALTSPALAAGGGAGGGGGGGGGGAGGGAGGGGAGGGAGGGGPAQIEPRAQVPTDLTTCAPGQVWDTKHHKCLVRHSGVLPDPDLTEYAFALAKADRYQEAIDVLDLLNNPNTPRALNYRGYATRKLGHTDEGIAYYLKAVALDPSYPQVREYLGEAYVIEGKYDLAKDQLATIQTLCGTECEYYEDLADALTKAHAL
jgi:tetratricopeptide (TPR) repeat protein